MELPLILLLIAYLLLPIFLLFSHLSLKRTVDELRERLEAMQLGKKVQPQVQAQAEVQVETPELTPATTVVATSAEPSSLDSLVNWLKEDWPMKAGAILLLLGFGWLTTYAFMNNWIGPVGRISLGIGAGLVILLLGEWRCKRSVPQGGVLLALGGASILLTIFAGRTVYDFFTPTMALIFMSLVVVFMAYSSVKHHVLSVAAFGLFMGGAVPFLIDSPEPNFIGLFSYLFVLCAGTLWVVALTGWKGLNNLALFFVALYSFVYVETPEFIQDPEKLTEMLFAFAFAALFFASTMARIIKNKIAEPFDLVTAVGSALLLLFWINEAVTDEWKSLVTAAVMLVFFAAAYAVFKKTGLKATVYVYGGVAFLFLVAATRFELDDNTLFVLAYTVEAALMMLGMMSLTADAKMLKNTSLLFIPAVLGGINSVDSIEWKEGILHADFFVLMTLALFTLTVGVIFRKLKIDLAIPFLVVGSVYSVVWVWLSADALIVDPAMAVMAALVLYTLTGLGLNLTGTARNMPTARTMGAIFIGMVILRLLLVDVWDMDITGKIITFFVIGSLLLSTAFLGKKLAHS